MRISTYILLIRYIFIDENKINYNALRCKHNNMYILQRL